VVQVPDRDVPFVSAGDPAVVEIDALAGAVYRTTADRKVEVSRAAEAEDPHTRVMRTEIDLPNPDGRLRRGMYGRVTLTLSQGATTAVRVPSAALVGKAEGGKAAVRVVRGETAHLVPVRYGADTGAEVEILSGLTPADRVVVRANGPVEDGAAVTAVEHAGRSGH
jgi:HlyD family secretion protein